MNIGFINKQFDCLLNSSDYSILNESFNSVLFKEKIEECLLRSSNCVYESSTYDSLLCLHRNIRQVRIKKCLDLNPVALLDLEKRAAMTALSIKAAHFDQSIDFIKQVQQKREKEWPLYLRHLCRTFKIKKEIFQKVNSLLEKGRNWKKCQWSFAQSVNAQFSEKQASPILSIIEHAYLIFRQIHTKEDEFILDYFEQALKEDEKFASRHPEWEEYLFKNLNLYVQQVEKSKACQAVTRLLPACVQAVKERNAQDYLLQGICLGSVLNYIEKRREQRKSNKVLNEIPLSKEARYYQACHELNLSYKLDFNEDWQNYHIQEAMIDSQLSSQPELKHLTLKKETIHKQKEAFLAGFNQNYADSLFPLSLIHKLGLKLEEVIGPSKLKNEKKLSFEDFILCRLDVLVEKYKEKEAEFILLVEDFFEFPSIDNEACTWREIEKKVKAIGGENAPLTIQNRIRARLLSSELKIGHAVYLSLGASFELKDSNFPAYDGLRTSNIENFKLMLLAWYTLFPYQTVKGLYCVYS